MAAKLNNILNIPKPIWLFIVIIFALLGSIIGVSTHIDSLQFQEIDRLNEKLHALDKQVAVNNERLEALANLEERDEKEKNSMTAFSCVNNQDI